MTMTSPCLQQHQGWPLTNGKTTLFSKDSWLNGLVTTSVAPALFIDSALALARKSRMVADALKRDSWVHNLEHVWTDDMMEELLTFANLLQHITLAPAVNDQIIWKLTADRAYSASSTYTTSSLRQLLDQSYTILFGKFGCLPNARSSSGWLWNERSLLRTCDC